MKNIHLGLNIAAGFILFTFLGIWLDKKYETDYWVLIGVGFAFIYMIYEVWKVIQDTKDSSKSEKS